MRRPPEAKQCATEGRLAASQKPSGGNGSNIALRVDELGWLYIGVTVVFGVCLYWLRCWRLALYGAAEIVVALVLIFLFFFPQGPATMGVGSQGFLGPVWGEVVARTVTLFGGLYALVRGLDNIDARQKWNRVRQVVRERVSHWREAMRCPFSGNSSSSRTEGTE